jgi:hypothetical protein
MMAGARPSAVGRQTSIVDVGANLGLYSGLAAHLTHPNRLIATAAMTPRNCSSTK